MFCFGESVGLRGPMEKLKMGTFIFFPMSGSFYAGSAPAACEYSFIAEDGFRIGTA